MTGYRFAKLAIALLVTIAFFAGNVDCYGKSSSSSSSRSSSSSSRSSSSSGSYGSSVSKSSSSSSSSSTNKSTSTTSSGSYGSSVGKSTSSSGSDAGSGVKSSGSGYGSSVSKPGDAAGSTSASTATGSGTAKTASSGVPPKSALQQKLDRSYSKQESAKALDSYKLEQTRFKAGNASSGPISGGEQAAVSSIRSRTSYGNSGDYYSRREGFYSSYGWSPPSYVYQSYSSFGVWDAMMLWFMIDHIQDSQYRDFYYHHRNDPGMQQFRQELDKMSAENADLKAKVAKLDAETKELEAKGVAVDPSYVPPDAGDVALAATIANKEIPVKKSSGFPWFWTFVAITGLGLGGYYFLRRRR